MIKQALVSFLVILTLLVAPAAAFADGMVISRPDPYSDRWDYSDETDQQAFINYANGLQKMVVGVKIDGISDKNAVWIFPVPADPTKVVVDVVEELPSMNGQEVSSTAKMNLSNIGDFLTATQIYPLVTKIGQRSYHSGNTLDISAPLASKSMSMGAEEAERDVVVYEHIDKEGMTSEIITAKTADGLYKYFENKGLKVEAGMIPELEAYIGKDYSFVASWITNASGSAAVSGDGSMIDDWNIGKDSYPTSNPSSYYRGRQVLPQTGNVKGISVFFPTDSIYFPLLPTSVYESKIVPATIKVVGYTTPKIYESIKNFSKVSYYTEASFNGGKDNEDFFANTDAGGYTKIEISAPSKYLTEDLWIQNRAPIKTIYSLFFATYPWAVGLFLLIFCSLAAAFAAGMILFKDLRKKPWRLLVLGLANCLSLIGLIVATIFARMASEPKGDVAELVKKMEQKGYPKARRRARIYLFAAVALLVFIPYGFNLLGDIFDFGYYMPDMVGFILGILVLYAPLILGFIGWQAAQVAAEDKPLFAELKAKGYSSWTFAANSGNKWLFVVFFSLLFLVFSWLATWFLGKTV